MVPIVNMLRWELFPTGSSDSMKAAKHVASESSPPVTQSPRGEGEAAPSDGAFINSDDYLVARLSMVPSCEGCLGSKLRTV